MMMTIPRIDDRWLWLGLGVFTLLAAHGIRYAIQDLVTITKLDPYGYEPKHAKKDDHFEDSVPLADLQKLTQSPDPNLANSALVLLVSRVRRSPAVMESMRKDLRSQNENTRRLATTAFDFLREYPDDSHRFERSPPRLPYDDFGRAEPRESMRGDMLANQELARRLQADRIEAGSVEEVGWVVPSIENPVAGWTDVPTQRLDPVANGDDDEVRRRRTRREAMVLHEGSGRLVEEDIIPYMAASW